MSDDIIVLSYMTGTLGGVESAGQAVGYSLNSSDRTNWVSIGMNISLSKRSESLSFFSVLSALLVIFSIPFAWTTIRKIGVKGFKKINFGVDKRQLYEEVPLLLD